MRPSLSAFAFGRAREAHQRDLAAQFESNVFVAHGRFPYGTRLWL